MDLKAVKSASWCGLTMPLLPVADDEAHIALAVRKCCRSHGLHFEPCAEMHCTRQGARQRASVLPILISLREVIKHRPRKPAPG